MNIFVDYDGTLADSIDTILYLYREETSYKLRNYHKKEDCLKWDMSDVLPELYKGEVPYWNHVLDFFDSEIFFKEVTYIENARAIVDMLNLLGHNIIICTSGLPKNLEYKIPKLHEDFPYASILPVFMQGANGIGKSVINMEGGIFIDDHIDNLITSNAKHKILFSYEGYNQEAEWFYTDEPHDDIVRLTTWLDVYNYIDVIVKESKDK